MGSETRAGISETEKRILLISLKMLFCSVQNLHNYFITSYFLFAEIFIIKQYVFKLLLPIVNILVTKIGSKPKLLIIYRIFKAVDLD